MREKVKTNEVRFSISLLIYIPGATLKKKFKEMQILVVKSHLKMKMEGAWVARWAEPLP